MSGRIRTIKPEILEDERTASLSDGAWRLFVSMWLLADDSGNLRASSRLLAGAVFWASRDPRETVASTSRDIRELICAGLVTLYEAREQTYAHILGWSKHQKIDRPSKPRVPGPKDPESVQITEYSRDSRDSLASLSDQSRETLAMDHDHDLDHDQDPVARACAREEDTGGGSTDDVSGAALPVVQFETRIPVYVARSEAPFWREAYQTAVRAVTGDNGWTFDAREGWTLERVINARCSDRSKIASWLEIEVSAFVRAARSKPSVYSAYQPRGFERWYNEGKPEGGSPSAIATKPAPPASVQRFPTEFPNAPKPGERRRPA